ncbi:Uncharacterised protein g2225 [Pycnogonum litorale]
MDSRLFGLTIKDFQKLAYEFAVRNRIKHQFNDKMKMAGDDFVAGFKKRHNRLSLRSAEKTFAARAAGLNKVVVKTFFGLLESLMKKYNFPPSRIYNNDETGIMTVPNKSSKILSLKGKKQVGMLSSAERGIFVTAEVYYNAIGNYLPPLLVFARKKVNPMFEVGVPPETVIAAHQSGWMQSEIFRDIWFEHFLKFTKPTAEDPVLLIFDGHATHTKTINLIERARANHMHILVIPPHTSHRLQPLDVSFMAPLSTYYEQEVRYWLRNHPGKVITIYQVGELFGTAYRKAATASTAMSGFAKTGIYPFNPHIFPDYMFTPAETTDIPLPALIELGQDPPTEVPAPENATASAVPSGSGEGTRQVTQPAEAPILVPAIVLSATASASKPSSSTASADPEEVQNSLSDAGSKDKPNYVSSRDIMGDPKVTQLQPRRQGVKRGKTVILTGSPYLKELREEQELRDKKRKKTAVQLFPEIRGKGKAQATGKSSGTRNGKSTAKGKEKRKGKQNGQTNLNSESDEEDRVYLLQWTVL